MRTVILALLIACGVEEDHPRWECASVVSCDTGDRGLEGPVCAETLEEATERHLAAMERWITSEKVSCMPNPETVTCKATTEFCVPRTPESP